MSRPIQVKPADSESRTGNLCISLTFYWLKQLVFVYLTDRLFIG